MESASRPLEPVRYCFGDFVLDCGTRQLVAGGRETHLSPKAFELLSLLVQNHARAVSKHEVLERLWPGTFVEETNIASLVAEIRRALGDPSASPAFIRTVHRFGYRFAGDILEQQEVSVNASRCCVVQGDRVIHLAEGANVIGRAFGAAIQLDSPGVSRQHARINVSDEKVVLEDLGSKNGTLVNDEKVDGSRLLVDGDRIRLGTVVVTFRVGVEQSPTQTVSKSVSASSS